MIHILPLLPKVHKSVGFGRDSSSLRSVRMTHSPHQKASTSLSVLEYLAVSTRVLGLKYCSTCAVY